MDGIIEKLIPKLEKVIELARTKRLDIENSQMGQSSSDVNAFSENNIEDTDCQEKLTQYLNTFTDNEIMLTQTIMYIGRDENKESLKGESLESLLNAVMETLRFELDTKINRVAEINQMTGKAPLDQYLHSGLDILRKLKER